MFGGNLMNNDVKVELFEGTQELFLKRIESRTSERTGNKYYLLYFDMCVKADSKNWRNNRFMTIPLFCTLDKLRERFSGVKPSDLIGQKFLVHVLFKPNRNGRFLNWEPEILDLEVIEGEKLADVLPKDEAI